MLFFFDGTGTSPNHRPKKKEGIERTTTTRTSNVPARIEKPKQRIS
tara:strand:- start:331 stop:468 length:138 start_codon:yes stop_codon:yes gene_type:complete